MWRRVSYVVRSAVACAMPGMTYASSLGSWVHVAQVVRSGAVSRSEIWWANRCHSIVSELHVQVSYTANEGLPTRGCAEQRPVIECVKAKTRGRACEDILPLHRLRNPMAMMSMTMPVLTGDGNKRHPSAEPRPKRP